MSGYVRTYSFNICTTTKRIRSWIRKIKRLFLFKSGFLQNLFEAFLPGLHLQKPFQINVIYSQCFCCQELRFLKQLAFMKNFNYFFITYIIFLNLPLEVLQTRYKEVLFLQMLLLNQSLLSAWELCFMCSLWSYFLFS